MNSIAARATRFGGLDGLRAIAVCLVLGYHFFPSALPGGFLGVDVFFAISGFLITSLLLREYAKHGRISLRGFWQRRARRLLPALALVLLVSTTLAALVGGDLLVGIGRQLAGASLFVSNWVFIASGTDYFARDTPELFRNTWSLAIEEQFYIVLPLIVLVMLKVFRRQTNTLIFIGLGAVSAILMLGFSLAGANTTRVYFGSDSHTFGLLFGAALAFLLARASTEKIGRVGQLCSTVVTVAGLALIGWLTLTLREGSPESFRGGFQLATIAALAVIWAVTRPGAFAGRLLDFAPLRWIGERSYGLYLWHWPLLLIVSAAFPASPGWVRATIALAVTVLFSAASYRFIEQPVRTLGLRGSLAALVKPRSYTPRRRTVAATLGALLCVTVPGTAFAVTNAPIETSAQAAINRGAEQLEAGGKQAAPKPAMPAPAETDVAAPATPGGPPAAPPVVTGGVMSAIGDSVMLASAPELGEAFPGVAIDAAVSRGMGVGVGIVEEQRADGSLRHVLVVGLGTNGPVEAEDLDALRTAAARNPIVLVNAYGERDWIPGVNAELERFAIAHRGVVVADWDGSVAGVDGALAGDGIHPNPSGAEIYAASVKRALAELDTPAESLGFGLARR